MAKAEQKVEYVFEVPVTRKDSQFIDNLQDADRVMLRRKMRAMLKDGIEAVRKYLLWKE